MRSAWSAPSILYAVWLIRCWYFMCGLTDQLGFFYMRSNWSVPGICTCLHGLANLRQKKLYKCVAKVNHGANSTVQVTQPSKNTPPSTSTSMGRRSPSSRAGCQPPHIQYNPPLDLTFHRLFLAIGNRSPSPKDFLQQAKDLLLQKIFSSKLKISFSKRLSAAS